MKNILEINGLKAEVATKVQGCINILDTDRKIPVTLINGAKEGKSLLITAGVHGGEYPCIKAAIEIAKEIGNIRYVFNLFSTDFDDASFKAATGLIDDSEKYCERLYKDPFKKLDDESLWR